VSDRIRHEWNGDEPQLREEAVLGTDEQAGAGAQAAFGREAVGLSWSSGVFKRLLAWLEISFRVTAVSCC
jgi:hypothetical protein